MTATFFMGFLGALLAMGLFGAGGAVGWYLGRRSIPAAQPPGEEERRRMAEQQQAFHQLQNYSAERAYGLVEEYR